MLYTSQQASFALAFEPATSALFARSPWQTVSEVAQYLAETNPYNENSFLARALKQAFPNQHYSVQDYIEHQLWCAWREAQWQHHRLDFNCTRLNVINAHYYEETFGSPTLVVSPMTTTLSDALLLIRHLHQDRPVILYGEDIASIEHANAVNPDWIAGDGLQALRRIQKTLAANGILCTYPDFVYTGHASCLMPFFKGQRPLSSGFASLASKRHSDANTMLLPCVLLHQEPDQITVHFEEPTEVSYQADCPKSYRQSAISELIGGMLEDLIQLAGPQWLLLPTLTYATPQMVATS